MSRLTYFGIFALVGTVLLVILYIIDFPQDLWTPSGAGEFLRAFLTAGLIACCTCAIFVGPVDWLQELLGEDPSDLSAISGSIGAIVGLGFLYAIILAIRYIFLIIKLLFKF